jgi:branched-chain amino acid transport system ATP-binding protein
MVTVLEVKNLEASYDKLKVLHGINLEVNNGEIVLIIGHNGSGKSTLLKCIAGLIQKDSGQIIFKGEKMTFVPQGRRIFGSMTVEENLEIGGYKLSSKCKVQSAKLKAFELFPILEEKRRQRANLLSGGQQQMLSIARGLMIEPDLLILDEPSLGLDQRAMSGVFQSIKEINQKGTAILLVEQNIKEGLKLANRVYEMKEGTIR